MHLAEDTDHLVGPCEHSYEPSGSVEDREFLDYPSDYKLIKKECAQ
jgi:hypothetical protein